MAAMPAVLGLVCIQRPSAGRAQQPHPGERQPKWVQVDDLLQLTVESVEAALLPQLGAGTALGPVGRLKAGLLEAPGRGE